VFEQIILKIGTCMLIYLVLLISQVVYPEMYETHTSKIDERKPHRIAKWFEPATEWLIAKASKAGRAIDQWMATHKCRKHNRKAQAIARRMQQPRASGRRWMALVAYTAVAMQATDAYQHNTAAMFDTDSSPIGVDNRCTGCISNRIDDFEGPLTESGRSIKGFGGSRTNNVMIGTIVWRWQDDNGTIHKFTIPKSFYVKDGDARLLSPQHWAQTQKDKTGTGSETLADKVTLFWGHRKHSLTIPLSKHNNVATFNSAPGYSSFLGFCAEAEVDY
jgi:hypothetical protein